MKELIVGSVRAYLEETRISGLAARVREKEETGQMLVRGEENASCGLLEQGSKTKIASCCDARARGRRPTGELVSGVGARGGRRLRSVVPNLFNGFKATRKQAYFEETRVSGLAARVREKEERGQMLVRGEENASCGVLGQGSKTKIASCCDARARVRRPVAELVSCVGARGARRLRSVVLVRGRRVATRLPLLRGQADFHPDLLIFGTNSFYTFTLDLTIFLLVVKTTALTINIAGVIQDGLLIAFSWSVIRDTITPINLFRYDVTFLGVSYYNKGPHDLFFHHIHPPLGFPFGSIKRQDTPVVAVATAAPVHPRGWLMLAQSCRALEPTKRVDSVVHAVATVEVSCVVVGEENTVDYEKLDFLLSVLAFVDLDNNLLDKHKKVNPMLLIVILLAEDVALIEYAKLTSRPFTAFSLDTRRLNPKTYRFFDTIEKHYRINIEYMFLDAGEIHALLEVKASSPFPKMGTRNAARKGRKHGLQVSDILHYQYTEKGLKKGCGLLLYKLNFMVSSFEVVMIGYLWSCWGYL
ncbi:hypothetical protein ZIOFF_024084 [Zingiber officinale]|uniref:Phosphoadenosine phosphosulphate reductase domain-containing protein n=1 Tax=Zingiber officinale TaxID=94328 RepID=A0A8J5GXR3_ZINOF|nr:hypothetical protein ZIOFF_024084 [Zingiber officinale]